MSLSRRSDSNKSAAAERLTSMSRSALGHPWPADMIKTPAPCPDCGKMQLVYVTGAYRRGVVLIENLRHLRCKSCKSKFYDDTAMGEIEKHRKLVTAR